MDGDQFVAARLAAVAQLIALASADGRIEALWLQGSLADGTSDALSDVDAYLAITDDVFDAVYAARLELIAQIAPPLAWSNATTPGLPAVHALLDGPVKFDLFFERASKIAEPKRPAAQVLLDKTGITAALDRRFEPPRAAFVFDVMVRMARQGALWPIRLLRRGQWTTFAMMELDLINKEIAQAMALQVSAVHLHTNPFSLSRALGAAQRAELEMLTHSALAAVSIGEPEAMLAAHLAVFDALVREQRAACAALGAPYPIDAAADDRIRELLIAHWPLHPNAASAAPQAYDDT